LAASRIDAGLSGAGGQWNSERLIDKIGSAVALLAAGAIGLGLGDGLAIAMGLEVRLFSIATVVGYVAFSVWLLVFGGRVSAERQDGARGCDPMSRVDLRFVWVLRRAGGADADAGGLCAADGAQVDLRGGGVGRLGGGDYPKLGESWWA